MPITTPPIPKAESAAPTTSTVRGPAYGTSRMSLRFARTIPITTTSPRNPMRHVHAVVKKPPISGPTAAAIAAAAPTRP